MTNDNKQRPYRRCAAVVLINRDGLIWAGRRNDSGDGRVWQMPQGGIGKGEKPRQAALRELTEETGVTSAAVIAKAPGWYKYDLPSALIGIALKGRYRGQKQRWFACRFYGEDDEIDISGHGHRPEFDSWRWVTSGAMLDMAVPFKRDVYEQVFTAFAPLIR